MTHFVIKENINTSIHQGPWSNGYKLDLQSMKRDALLRESAFRTIPL